MAQKKLLYVITNFILKHYGVAFRSPRLTRFRSSRLVLFYLKFAMLAVLPLSEVKASFDLPAWTKGHGQESLDSEMQAIIQQVENNGNNAEIEKEVRALVKEIESRDYSQEEKEIRDLFSQFNEQQFTADNKEEETGRAKYQLPNNHELLIFVSLSLPNSLLLQLQQQAKDYGAILVLQGLVNDSFKDTYQALQPLIQQHEIGFSIEPELFDKFGINKVPSMVLYENSNCPKNLNCSKFDKISGNISVAYFLEKIEQEGDLSSVLKERKL